MTSSPREVAEGCINVHLLYYFYGQLDVIWSGGAKPEVVQLKTEVEGSSPLSLFTLTTGFDLF